VVDDLYAYRLGDQEYLLIVNASRATTDFEWLQRQLADFAGARNVRLRDVSPDFGAIAIQGPKVAGFIDACFKGPSTSGTPVNSASELTKNECSQFNFGGTQVWLSRTGYTGEDGFEVVARSDVIEAIWNKVLEQGKPHGLKPAGLGARDTLRTEMCYPLYGHELDENTSPLEAGVGFFVALGKDNFIGKAALAAQKERGLAKKLAAFKMTGKAAPPRPDYAIWTGADPATLIGKVVSGTQSPSLSIGIGMGYVPPEFAKPGTPLQVEVRGKKFAAVVVAKPLYRKPG